jgi:hypothetical protein
MTCRHCGTEIAEKALVCYRCGHATADPPARKAEAGVGRSRVPVVAALVILVLCALFMSQAAVGQAPRAVSWAVAVLAVVVLAWRLWRKP